MTVAQEAALRRVGDNFHRTRQSHNVNVDPSDLAEVLKLAGYYDIRPPEKRKVTAAEVLSFLDFFAGQEDTAEDVRDFVQMAGRFVAEGKTRQDFRQEEEMFGGFISWLEEQEDELGFSDRAPAGAGIRHYELQLIIGEELRHGDLVAISKEDGKLYKARSGDKIEGAFRIPPTAVIEGDMLNIPREEWKL
jgi:hypothetical protein